MSEWHMTDSERMARAEQAKQALGQFLSPAFDVCRQAYIDALADIASKPMYDKNRAAMEKLAVGIKVIDEVRRQIENVVADGSLARADNDRAKMLANLSTEKRRWAMM